MERYTKVFDCKLNTHTISEKHLGLLNIYTFSKEKLVYQLPFYTYILFHVQQCSHKNVQKALQTANARNNYLYRISKQQVISKHISYRTSHLVEIK